MSACAPCLGYLAESSGARDRCYPPVVTGQKALSSGRASVRQNGDPSPVSLATSPGSSALPGLLFGLLSTAWPNPSSGGLLVFPFPCCCVILTKAGAAPVDGHLQVSDTAGAETGNQSLHQGTGVEEGISCRARDPFRTVGPLCCPRTGSDLNLS